MKINVSQVLKDFDGESVMEDMRVEQLALVFNEALAEIPDEKKRAELVTRANGLIKPLTLRKALVQAVSLGLDGLAPEKLERAFRLVAKMPKDGEMDLETEDITLLKEVVGKIYKSPLVVGQCRILLEGKDPFAADSKPVENAA